MIAIEGPQMKTTHCCGIAVSFVRKVPLKLVTNKLLGNLDIMIACYDSVL